ncbi:MAG: hypothetical protein HYZ92_04920 [Candidatus Omnitrophica bacterium]|nr:hypothetical protein [Candidatus Omnitrophota bacterium]
MRGLEVGKAGWDATDITLTAEELRAAIAIPTAQRIFQVKAAFEVGLSVEEIAGLTKIDPWFLQQMKELVEFEKQLKTAPIASGHRPQATGQDNQEPAACSLQPAAEELVLQAKQYGFSDRQLGRLWNMTEEAVRQLRRQLSVQPSYYLVDTCAAEFEAYTPYYYSTYENPTVALGSRLEALGQEQKPPASSLQPPAKLRKVMILGGGPNRIGQGIEFDYCCVHAAFALREMGVEVITVRRPDAAEPGRRSGEGRRADPGDGGGAHRPGRGPGEVPPAPGASGPSTTAEPHGADGGGGHSRGADDRLSVPDPALVCLGRPGDGNRV